MEYISMQEARDFRLRCLEVLDQQEFPLETEKAKKCAIQAVHRVIRDIYLNDGKDEALKIIRYPLRIESSGY